MCACVCIYTHTFIYLSMIPRSISNRKNRHMGLHENVKFCVSKDIIKKVERQLAEWEKIFANHVSHKGLVSQMYPKYNKLL